MMPGVTHLPLASITVASAGALTVTPTASTLPLCSSTEPFWMVAPAAVSTVALRMSVVRDGNGLYVDGNGVGGLTVSRVAATGVGVGVAGGAEEHASIPTIESSKAVRIENSR